MYPKSGFQNAPNFCQGTDKAMATYSFNVPKNLRPGKNASFCVSMHLIDAYKLQIEREFEKQFLSLLKEVTSTKYIFIQYINKLLFEAATNKIFYQT